MPYAAECTSSARELTDWLGSTTHAVAQVGDLVALVHRDGLELDVPGAEVLEEALAIAEQDGHEVDLDLVEEPGPKHALRNRRAVHKDALVAGRVPGPADRLGEVAQVGDVGVAGELRRRLVPAQDEDCLLYTSPSPRDGLLSRMPSSA